MNEEQMNKLAGMFTALGTQIETFGAKVDALTTDKKPDAADPAPAPVVDPVPATATTEQFSAFEQTLKGLGEQITSLNDKIEKFSVEAPNQRPDGLGGSDTNPTVC